MSPASPSRACGVSPAALFRQTILGSVLLAARPAGAPIRIGKPMLHSHGRAATGQ